MEDHPSGVSEAASEGRIWSRYGPEIAALFDRFRAEAARAATPEKDSTTAAQQAMVFREALRELMGIELVPGA